MNIWTADKIMKRLNAMLEHAMAGEAIETSYDETKMSALESKMTKYIAMNQLGKQQLQQEKEKVNELISDISHQTKTPIANLMLYTELLEEQLQDVEQKELLKAIHVQTEKLSFLIQALIKSSRLENGIVQTVPKENSVSELIESAVLQIDSKAQSKGIEVVVNPTESRGIFDMKWTGEAVCNILDNAVKYTKPGGRIEISVSEYTLFTRIDIADSGIGIAEYDLPQIFSRFYKVAETQQEEGVGLGLYLARELITMQGGYIKVESKLGIGSKFSVFLRSIT